MSQIHSMSVPREHVEHPSSSPSWDGNQALCNNEVDPLLHSLVRPYHFRELLGILVAEDRRYDLLCDHCVALFEHEEETGRWP